MLAINGTPDHIHMLIGMRPVCCLSDLVREVKKSSTDMINQNQLVKYHFQWQEGFGAFSYSKSAIDHVIKYIHRQKEHHAKQSFKQEYFQLLDEFEIDFKEEYLFDWFCE